MLRDFANIFVDFAQIFTDFARLFDKSKLLGVRLHPLHARLLHHCIVIRGPEKVTRGYPKVVAQLSPLSIFPRTITCVKVASHSHFYAK